MKSILWIGFTRLMVLVSAFVTLAKGELHPSPSSTSTTVRYLRGGFDRGDAVEELSSLFTEGAKLESNQERAINFDDDVVIATNDLKSLGSQWKIQTSATTTNKAPTAVVRRHLSSSFTKEWRQLDPDERLFVLLGMAVAFLACWCFMTCLCNCLRAYFCGTSRNRTEYRQIDSAGRTVVYRDSYYTGGGPNRPFMNLLWGTCCFECCCRDNQDVDCCKICCPLLLVECCCPP